MAVAMRREHIPFKVVEDIETGFARFKNSFEASNQHPFAGNDSTVGMEYELQVAVEGDHRDIDLPIVIRNSSFFKNIVKRTARGDLSESCLTELQDFLYNNTSRTWENSWVRLRPLCLSASAKKQLDFDLLKDKSDPQSKKRSDIDKFFCQHRGKRALRIPVSYLLKLSLADAIGSNEELSPVLLATGRSLLDNFLSDNTSPEILSFTIPKSSNERIGDLAARESARTLLLCQLLVQYANEAFGLKESGQKVLLYSAPHAPLKQKRLNNAVPDGFYRQLFMSPCLSGWDRGEEKHKYMELCHKTLSRSQLNTLNKLKDAGIITNNLIVLPNTSNTCLANNGTHVSLGSQRLTKLARQGSDIFTPEVEKYYGDLVIKIVEHFLPLLVGTYTAAPYKLDFSDFHPERVLGFLPHELDYTHLRMIWRRWKKKADLSFMGRTFTPFGPRWIDRPLAKILRLKGDLVPDFRLIDYLVSLLSTESGPGLNGIPGNQERLKEELGAMGVFEPSMSIYLPYRQRFSEIAGYSGFEGRSYSLFSSLKTDMAEAVDMQNLITALACKYVLSGKICHSDIPDRPSIESERRQVFFCTAIGIPTFYVRKDSGNRFLKKILSEVVQQRNSKRYRGYIRVNVEDYLQGLRKIILADAADLIESLQLHERMESLQARLADRNAATSKKLISGAVSIRYPGKNGGELSGDEFNESMEAYYRTALKKNYLSEALDLFCEECRELEKDGDPHLRNAMAADVDVTSSMFIEKHRKALLEETADLTVIKTMIAMSLAVITNAKKNSV